MSLLQHFLIFAIILPCLIASDHVKISKDSLYINITSDELISRYQNSVIVNSNPVPERIYTGLFPLTHSNPKARWSEINGEEYILMLNVNETDGKFQTGTKYYNDEHDIWVTSAPQLHEYCHDYLIEHPGTSSDALSLIISQLLGLPGNLIGRTLVEFWIRPQDLFRPCPDADITDDRCDINFPADVTPEHRHWINTQRSTFYAGGYSKLLYGGFPWTQLGYTYNWAADSKDNIGISEYVIPQHSHFYVKAVHNVYEYCAN